MHPVTHLFSRSLRSSPFRRPLLSSLLAPLHQRPSSLALRSLRIALQHRVLSTSLPRLQSSAPSTPSPPATTPESIPAELERKPWRAAPHRRPNEPVYELYFTCNVCKHRQGHSVSKQGYHRGTVLVTCEGCRNRHLISDHLKIFYDRGVTLEDILAEKGSSLKLGTVDEEGDVEFWEEETADKIEQEEKVKEEAQTNDEVK